MTESEIKISLAKLQAETKSLSDDIAQLESNISRADTVVESQKARAIAEAKAAFQTKQQKDLRIIEEKCAEMYQRADALLDTFPTLKSKEYEGRYEIKEIERQLSKFYPESLLGSYVCRNPIIFEDEGEAYKEYTYVERKVLTLKQSSLAGALFSTLTSLMTRICTNDGASAKIGLIVMGVVALSFVLSPFIFLTIFTVIGVSAAVQGTLVGRLLRGLYSVKGFLNTAYDEDIFQEDKQDILRSVEDYLEEAKEQFISDVNNRKFVMNPNVIEGIVQASKLNVQKNQALLQSKLQVKEQKQNEIAKLLDTLDEVQREREENARKARAAYFETIDWKYEWCNQMLLDVTSDNRVQGVKWSQSNTVYYGSALDNLQNFWQLVVYQGMLKMNPNYCSQVVLDYKYLGSNLVRYSVVPQSILTLCVDKETIDKKVERIRDDIKARCNNILSSCENLDEFNKLMATYDSTGESYVVIHICGLSSVTPDLKMFMKNGPKVGYFFKLYLTVEEAAAIAKEIPYDDIPEYVEIGTTATPRTVANFKRMIDSGA